MFFLQFYKSLARFQIVILGEDALMFASRPGLNLWLRHSGIPFPPLCQCLSEEILKAVGPFYLVSMPLAGKDPTSLHWNCLTVVDFTTLPGLTSRVCLCQSWVQLQKITSITITLKYRLQLQLHHHNVILNYNYTMFISITITVPFLRKLGVRFSLTRE